MKEIKARLYTQDLKLSKIVKLKDINSKDVITINGQIDNRKINEIYLDINKSTYVLIQRENIKYTYFITCLHKVPIISDIEIEQFIEKHGELIGSRRWGGFKENSDYDIAFPLYK